MMSEAPENARYAIIAHVVHLVNRDYEVCHLLALTAWICYNTARAILVLRE